MPGFISTSGVLALVGQALPPALRRHSRLVPRPSDLFLGASGLACPAPTPRPGRGEACLAHLEAL